MDQRENVCLRLQALRDKCNKYKHIAISVICHCYYSYCKYTKILANVRDFTQPTAA